MTDLDPTDQVDVTVSPTLPGLELPEYQGRTPSGMKTSINGAGNRLTRAHGIGDRVILVVEAKVRKAGHEEGEDGLVYTETLKVVDLFEITGDPGHRLLSTVRQAYRTSDDERGGRRALEDLTGEVNLGTAGVTDASGVVLTEAELAELRGDDPVRAMLDDDRTPVVVVFSDAGREMWPDEFAAGEARPKAGQRFEVDDDGDYVYVAELLHAETGEQLAVWTTEQEDARLLALEEEAGRAEAREDREAAEQLEAAREAAKAERLTDDLGAVIPGPGETWVDPAVAAEERAEAGVDRPADDEVPDEDLADDDVSGLGDGLEPFEKEEPPLPGEDFDERGPLTVEDEDGFADVVQLDLPTDADFKLVDCKVAELGAALDLVVDVARLRRLRKAEKQGRGRGLQPRESALKAIDKRIADLGYPVHV